MLSSKQLHGILEILDRQFILFVGKTIGEEGLTDQEKKILKDYGIDYKKLYDESKDIAALNFQLGMLSNILEDQRVQKFDYKSLVKYIKDGNYIPLNAQEKAVLNSIKMQSLADIRSAKGKIFNDINNVVSNNLSSNRANQEEFIREKVLEGVAQRKSKKEIAREIARLTGDWKRNFNKSVSYISHTALNEGRAAIIERRYGGNDKAQVWFLVQPEACKYCVKAYLTNGEGSEPKIFTIRELQNNGNNIGKKVNDWLPTMSALHVNCRCTLQEYIPGSVWNGKIFVPSKETTTSKEVSKKPENKPARPKIRILINGIEHWV